MNKKLRAAILTWLLEHENEWQRANSCTAAFRSYIYDNAGQYLIRGREVAEFISAADALLYPCILP